MKEIDEPKEPQILRFERTFISAQWGKYKRNPMPLILCDCSFIVVGWL
jgi:hypothetical protein